MPSLLLKSIAVIVFSPIINLSIYFPFLYQDKIDTLDALVSNQLKLIRNFPGRAAHSITTVPVQHPLRRCVTIIKSIHSIQHVIFERVKSQNK